LPNDVSFCICIIDIERAGNPTALHQDRIMKKLWCLCGCSFPRYCHRPAGDGHQPIKATQLKTKSDREASKTVDFITQSSFILS